MPVTGAPEGVYQRRLRPPAPRSVRPIDGDYRAEFAKQAAGEDVGPCSGCRRAEECKHGRACTALELWVNTGRYSEVAPRQPSREIYAKLFG